MKNLFTLLALIPTLSFGQGLVGTAPETRSVLIEEYTGVNCGYCPDGHAIAAAIKDANEGKVVTVNIHAGGFAVPQAGQIDFRTPDGDALNSYFGVSSYPSGVVSRVPYSGNTVLGRSSWGAAADAVLAMNSPVNLGLQSSFDANTRDLTVDVEILYTDNSPGGNDYITVYLLESNVIGYQSDYTNGAHPNYNHKHALRGAITQVWGDEVLIGTAGHTETRQYTYNVPMSFDIASCDVVAFIGEYQGAVYQAHEVIADGGTTLIVGSLDLSSSSSYASGSNGSTTSFANNFTNTLLSPEDFVFELTSANAPIDWAASYTVNSSTYTSAQTLNMMNSSPAAVSVDITPGSTVGVADYVLTVSSVNNPNAPVLTQEFHIISGVTDLIIDNPGAEVHGPLYDAGLVLAGQAGAGHTTVTTAMDFADNGALNDVINIYYNVSWTFPAFSDATVAQLTTLLDNGVNLLIAGQDIGWDVMSNDPNSNGTAAGQSFYQNYMMANYVADGSTSNSAINFVDTDGVYAWTPNTTVNSVFGTNTYPEEITPTATSTAIFYYNTPTKIGGIRGENGTFKVVYLGVGVEQIADANVGAEVVKRAHDWFYGAVSTNEFDASMADILGIGYPVPANDQITIPVNDLTENAFIRILDATGKLVFEQKVNARNSNVALNTADFASGIYSYQLILSNGNASQARLFEVQH